MNHRFFLPMTRYLAAAQRYLTKRPRRYVVGAVITLFTLLMFSGSGWSQRNVPVRVDRYLSLQSLSGDVLVEKQGNSRPAQSGDRLQTTGDGVMTRQDSSARLAVDTGIGFVNVSENTRMQIKKIEVAPDNGRITHLEVPQGQIRLELRSFTHEGSELEIHTPAGVGSVRGTEFGVTVHPGGTMGIATLSGSVATLAQAAAVNVPAGFQNLTVPGQPPSAPVPLRDNPELTYTLDRRAVGGNRQLQLIGQVDPVNLVLIEGEPQALDANGRFTFPLRPVVGTRLQVTLVTPLGKRQEYDLPIL